MNVIDAKARLRTREMLRHWTDEIKPFFRDYVQLYKMEPRLHTMPVDEYVNTFPQYGIEKIVVCPDFQEENAHVLETAKRYEQIVPVFFISMENGILAAMKEAETNFKKGASAMYVAPYRYKINLNDKSLYPLYGLCTFYNKPVIVYGAIHFWSESSMWHGQPEYVDEVAIDFPELGIIVCHGGNGFGPSILAVAQRHENVYLEFSGLNPQYMAPEFMYAANTYLKNRCIFGTDYPLMDFDVSISRWKKVIREDVQKLFFYENVKNILGI